MTIPARFTQVVPVLFVPDVKAAVRYYTEKLGFALRFDSPWDYAGVGRDGIELHIGKGQAPEASNRSADVYFIVQDIEALREELVASGAIPADQAVIEQPYGARELHLTDPFGYRLGFSEPVGER